MQSLGLPLLQTPSGAFKMNEETDDLKRVNVLLREVVKKLEETNKILREAMKIKDKTIAEMEKTHKNLEKIIRAKQTTISLLEESNEMLKEMGFLGILKGEAERKETKNPYVR